MADFRRWLTVLAVIAVMAFTASAQIGSGPGSSGAALSCTATAGGTPELRPEGFTELAGDILITCTGGSLYTTGTAVPTTNIVVYMTPGVPITSRFLSSNGASEALLLVDEPGSGLTTVTKAAFGPNAPQVVCAYSSTQIAGGSGCPAVAANDGAGNLVAASPTGCNTASGAGCTTAPNVFQGKVGDYGAQTVTFYGVPVLPPSTSGIARIYRITNVRVPVPGGQLTNQLSAFISTNPSTVLPISSSAITIGVVGPPMKAAVKESGNNTYQQCVPATTSLTATLTFTEGFATSFKTRVVPLSNTAWAAEGTNTGAPPLNQNIPGGLYGGFAQNTESGLIQPNLTGTISSVVYTAGLADYGTRLKAVFTNIPAGLTLYISNTSITPTIPAGYVPGGTSVLPFAVLVATNSGEATPDNSSSAGFSPVSTSTTQGPPNVTALSANSSGIATAIWEVTNSNPTAIDTLAFGVYISYTASSATAANPYGLPITVLPLGAPVNNVSLSFAPEPGGGTFTVGSNATQGQVPTPRFAIVNTYQGQFTTIGLCQTTLLYPFVTGASGFDTGIAIANTSWDPWKTVNQTGSCTLYGYGVAVATSGNTASQPVVQGCDMIANPLPGTNCFPVVPSGQVGTVLASATLPAFQGYVIAVCNFQYAHGYAAVTDLGIRNLWSSYLALELSNTPIGTTRHAGYSSVEVLAH